MQIYFLPRGYGSRDEIIARLPAQAGTVIRDDDAAQAGAASCWFYTEASLPSAVAAYEDDGGTVSEAFQHP